MACGVISGFQGDYRWLSNFEPVDVVFEGEIYPSVEHAYVAAKTLDRTTRRSIAALATPGAAKRAGKSIKLRTDWEEVKLKVMSELVRQKFQHVRMRKLLLATEDAQIIETNSWGDVFWGVCQGVGQNHLGRIIMEVRAEWMKNPTA